MSIRSLLSVLLFTLLSITGLCQSESKTGVFHLTVKSKKGALVDDAVLTLTPLSSNADKSFSKKTSIYQMVQKNSEFKPSVLMIPTGSKVQFPNLDKIKHNVYSLSKVKKINIPLYSKSRNSSPETTFEKPGIVTIGCNIHDWMLAHVFITNAPYYTKTLKGLGQFKSLPFGQYKLKIWHPRLKRKKEIIKKITIDKAFSDLEFELDVLPKKKRKKKKKKYNDHSYEY